MTDDPNTPARPLPDDSSPHPAETVAPGSLGIENPPTTFAGTLRRLGPGLIIAGSIVGSGELIATTKTGAQAGFTLLWLILIGCVIKVFVQIELGRYTISSGDTCLAGLNRVPGPRLRVNWIVWFWVAMTVFGLAQLGGIVGGVGQALALSFPIRGDYVAAVSPAAEPSEDETTEDTVESAVEELRKKEPVYTWDDKIWAMALTAVTIVMLVVGRYGFIQAVAMSLVVAFTFLTLGNVVSLQFIPEWYISADDIISGISFRLPEEKGLGTALATFGIIGVGASELVAYPYWCLEKGYARFTGPRTEHPEWVERARGWMMVMHYDAWLSMVIYTIATLAFYILGAAVLNRMGADPEGSHMVPVLAAAYEPAFGVHAKYLFLIGSFAVLYSTFFVAMAGISRVAADALSVFGLIERGNAAKYRLAVKGFCVFFPLVSISVFVKGLDPVALVLASGVMQSIMLPMLGVAALYFRYRRSDARLSPRKLWNYLLWISCLGLLVSGSVTAYNQVLKFLANP